VGPFLYHRIFCANDLKTGHLPDSTNRHGNELQINLGAEYDCRDFHSMLLLAHRCRTVQDEREAT
jgi:hypothetical protein